MRLAPYQTGKCPSHGGKTSRVKGGAIVPDLPLPTQGALQEGLSTSNPALPAVPPSALPPVPEVAGAPPMPPPPCQHFRRQRFQRQRWSRRYWWTQPRSLRSPHR